MKVTLGICVVLLFILMIWRMAVLIIESFRLEKTFKIIKSNANLALPSPSLNTTSTRFLNTIRDGDSTNPVIAGLGKLLFSHSYSATGQLTGVFI